MKGSLVSMLMIGGALATGAGAAYFANAYIDGAVAKQRAALDAQYEPTRVLVASSDLRAGALLSAQTIAVREVPRAFLHAAAIDADDWGSVAGRVLAHDVRSGEPVLQSHLARGLGAGFSTQLAAGMRAFTFPVDEESSIAGLLSPGDRIDIFFTTTSGNEPITLPLLVDVTVIATGVRTLNHDSSLVERQQSPFRTVTVSVAPQDAARITLAQDAGKISLALRQPTDVAPIELTRITKSTLLHGQRVAKASASRGRIEVILGGV